MSDPIENAQAEQVETEESEFGTVKIGDAEFAIERKPNSLLLSELARTGDVDEDNVAAIGVFAEFFEVTLGSNYSRFKRAVYRSDNPDEVMQEKLAEILAQTMGRPTE
jgi:hypothetical protein